MLCLPPQLTDGTDSLPVRGLWRNAVGKSALSDRRDNKFKVWTVEVLQWAGCDGDRVLTLAVLSTGESETCAVTALQ